MILLTSVSDKLQVITGSAGAVDIHASWVDNAAGVITPGRTNKAVASATTTDVVAAPAAATQRNIQTLTVRNAHATDPNAITVQHTDGSIVPTMVKCSLAAGETLQYVDGDGFFMLDSAGNRKVYMSPAAAPAGVVPVGGIVMWSGTIATIPATWALCDGTANAPGPDLRDKFVVGAKQDDLGVAKTNIEGTLKQTGGVSGHSHSGHANLSHTGITIGDHTGLTHGLTIANHPDLTHAALSHAASTFTHADHSVASQSHTHAAVTLTHADISLASFTGSDAAVANISVPSGSVTIASGTHTHAASTITGGNPTLTLSISSQGTARTIGTGASDTATIASYSGTHASQTGTIASAANASAASQTHTHAAVTVTQPGHSVPSFSGSQSAATLTHGDHSFPSLSHQAIGTHVGTDYGVHTFTAPASHGAAGTLTHSFSEPNDHAISAHDTILTLPNYFALAFIQRMS